MRFDISNKSQSTNPSDVPQIRVVFMGTPHFASSILERLIEQKYHIVAAYTRPNKPVGRTREQENPPVKTTAEQYHIPVEQPERFDEDAIRTLAKYKPDLIIVVAYGMILPAKILELPGFGCINVHASLLPRWRGASPIQNALLSGDTKTGVTIMLMDEHLDTGPILAQKNITINDTDTAETLTMTLMNEGADLLEHTLPLWIKRKIEARPQSDEEATLCQLIEREDGRIFWSKTAEEIFNQYRAFTPWPGIFTYQKHGQGEFDRIKFPRISIQKTNPAIPKKLGEVFEIGEHIAVQTGGGLVFIEEIQAAGKKATSIRDFINGRPEFLGSVLG